MRTRVAEALRGPRPARLRYWRRSHSMRLLRVFGPMLPEFRAVLDAALKKSPGGRLVVDAITDDDQEATAEREDAMVGVQQVRVALG
jgi:hypothetical protein